MTRTNGTDLTPAQRAMVLAIFTRMTAPTTGCSRQRQDAETTARWRDISWRWCAAHVGRHYPGIAPWQAFMSAWAVECTRGYQTGD